jgi:hypothetical protein
MSDPLFALASAGVAIPLWQEIRASHPNNAYRVIVSLGRAHTGRR